MVLTSGNLTLVKTISFLCSTRSLDADLTSWILCAHASTAAPECFAVQDIARHGSSCNAGRQTRLLESCKSICGSSSDVHASTSSASFNFSIKPRSCR